MELRGDAVGADVAVPAEAVAVDGQRNSAVGQRHPTLPDTRSVAQLFAVVVDVVIVGSIGRLDRRRPDRSPQPGADGHAPTGSLSQRVVPTHVPVLAARARPTTAIRRYSLLSTTQIQR